MSYSANPSHDAESIIAGEGLLLLARRRDIAMKRKQPGEVVDYAKRLSHYPNKGECGLPELYDTQRALRSKLKRLVNALESAKHVVVLTGAGISTSAGIPDFRGPEGVWTQEKRGVATSCEQDDLSCSFSTAEPTLTHYALTKLEKKGKVQYVVSQNVDGLHLKSGFPRKSLAELHGNLFVERCGTCREEYVRDYDIGGVGLKATGKSCERCGGDLRDTIVDWCDPLPESELEESMKQCAKADLLLCLGTSLRIIPVAELPLLAKTFAVVNLQTTPLDNQAAVVIRAKVDDVMQFVVEQMIGDEEKERVMRQCLR